MGAPNVTPMPAEWNPSIAYQTGDVVHRNGQLYRARFYTVGQDPDLFHEPSPYPERVIERDENGNVLRDYETGVIVQPPTSGQPWILES